MRLAHDTCHKSHANSPRPSHATGATVPRLGQSTHHPLTERNALPFSVTRDALSISDPSEKSRVCLQKRTLMFRSARRLFFCCGGKKTGEKRLQRDIGDRLALTCVSVTEKEDAKFRTNSTRVSEQLHPSSMKKENKRATRSH